MFKQLLSSESYNSQKHADEAPLYENTNER